MNQIINQLEFKELPKINSKIQEVALWQSFPNSDQFGHPKGGLESSFVQVLCGQKRA